MIHEKSTLKNHIHKRNKPEQHLLPCEQETTSNVQIYLWFIHVCLRTQEDPQSESLPFYNLLNKGIIRGDPSHTHLQNISMYAISMYANFHS